VQRRSFDRIPSLCVIGSKWSKKAMSFPIVGIGASAGGLESFSEVLSRVPSDTGMAYVFVQHLDPGHASRLVEILSKRAGFPVEQAREGLRILPNRCM
jgi:two-component system CheB/CheR fusion protein